MKDRAGALLNILRLGLKQGGAPLSSVRSTKGQRYPMLHRQCCTVIALAVQHCKVHKSRTEESLRIVVLLGAAGLCGEQGVTRV